MVTGTRGWYHLGYTDERVYRTRATKFAANGCPVGLWGEAEVKTVDHCKVVDKESKGELVREDPYSEKETPQVCKVRLFSSDRRYGRMYRGAARREDHLNCFTGGKRGHGYQRCLERICRECLGRGHDAHNCTFGWRGNNWRSQDRGTYARGDYVKNLSARTNTQTRERHR